eukprot:scaffold1554_cov401-Prasinococcus_capsulatus_cf.AAC.11
MQNVCAAPPQPCVSQSSRLASSWPDPHTEHAHSSMSRAASRSSAVRLSFLTLTGIANDYVSPGPYLGEGFPTGWTLGILARGLVGPLNDTWLAKCVPTRNRCWKTTSPLLEANYTGAVEKLLCFSGVDMSMTAAAPALTGPTDAFPSACRDWVPSWRRSTAAGLLLEERSTTHWGSCLWPPLPQGGLLLSVNV